MEQGDDVVSHFLMAVAGYHMVADVGVSAFIIDGDDAGDFVLVGAGLLQNGGQKCPAVTLDEDRGNVLIVGLQRHGAADVHGCQNAFAAGENGVHVVLPGAVAVTGIHGGFEELTVVEHVEVFLPGNVVVPFLFFGGGLRLGGVADELFIAGGFLQQLLGDLDLAGTGGALCERIFLGTSITTT